MPDSMRIAVSFVALLGATMTLWSLFDGRAGNLMFDGASFCRCFCVLCFYWTCIFISTSLIFMCNICIHILYSAQYVHFLTSTRSSLTIDRPFITFHIPSPAIIPALLPVRLESAYSRPCVFQSCVQCCINRNNRSPGREMVGRRRR